MKRAIKTTLALLLALSMMIPSMGMPAYAENSVEDPVLSELDHENSVEDPDLPEVNTEKVITDDFHNQYGTVLYKEGRLSCEADAMEFTYNSEFDQLVVSGKYDEIKNARILVDKEFDFGDSIVGRFSVNMTAMRKKYVKLGFYLDEEAEPFAETVLHRQRKDDSWEYKKNVSFDIYDRKLTGKHRISMAVLDYERSEGKLTFALDSFEFVKSSVPVVYFDLDEEDGTVDAMNESEDHSAECYGFMNLRVPDDYQGEYGTVKPGLQRYELEYIRGRGNSTWAAEKKPYKVKLAKKADLLGMGKQKHWILLANYFDNSLLRNKMTYWLGNEINRMNPDAYAYTPDCCPVDVVMNGEYYGSYLLCEQIRMGENRVDLRNLEDYPDATDEATISGGYLLSMEPYGDEENASFETSREQRFLVESPDVDGGTNPVQVAYIKNYVQKTEDAIYGEGFVNKDGTSCFDLMDLSSAAYYYLMQEFSINGDAFVNTSTYLYKKPDVYDDNGNFVEQGKLYWGPIWDFDIVAWGDTEYETPVTAGWFLGERAWYGRLFENREFATYLAKTAWPVYKAKLEYLLADGGQLDQYYQALESSASYNFEYFGFTNLEEDGNLVTMSLTYEEELQRLKNWIADRAAWFDASVEGMIPKECRVSFPGTTMADYIGVQGRPFNTFPKAPAKKGYTFTNWDIQVHYTYQEYLDLLELSSYKELEELLGKERAKEIKTNGFDSAYSFDIFDYLPPMSEVKFVANYVKSSELKRPTKLYVKQKQLNFGYYDIGANYWIKVIGAPFDASLDGLSWKTSNPMVATVNDSGMVTLVGEGSATITASVSAEVSVSCKVRVYKEEEVDELSMMDQLFVSGISLSAQSVQLDVDHYKQVRVNLDPLVALNDSFDYYMDSTDSSVAEVNEAGVIHGISEGSCLVYVYSQECGIRMCKVTVRDSRKLHIGDTFTRKGLKYKVTSARKGTVTCLGASKKTVSSVTIPTTFTYKNKKLSVTRVKEEAFKSYKQLEKVIIGSKVTSIGKKAFYNCQKLESVTIGKSVTSIGGQAFYQCKALKTLRIKAAFPKMYAKAFSKISAKVKIYVPKKWLSVYQAYFKKKKVIGKY